MSQSAPSFEESDAGRLLLNAVQYFKMANLVTESEEFRQNWRVYGPPMLNTIAVGIELFLKFVHVHHGKTIKSVASTYGHNIEKLWNDCPEPTLHETVFSAAERAYSSASRTGIADPIGDVRPYFAEAIRDLSKRHNTNGSELRYPAPKGAMVPRPGLFVQTFYPVADACLRRPPFGA